MVIFGTLKIVLHSGLKDVKHFGIMRPYATIYIAGADGTAETTKHVTNIARKGATDPVWDSSIVFNNVSMNKDYDLVIKIKHSGTFFDRKIGTVIVPFKDLLAGDYSGDRISYRVTTKADKTQGEIVLSHNFTDVVMRSGNDYGATTSNSNSNYKKKQDGKANKMMAKGAAGLLAEMGATIAGTLLNDQIEYDVN